MKQQTKSDTVLIVDNDTEMVELLSDKLVTGGYKVETARHLTELPEKIVISRASVVVLNLQMPDAPASDMISMIKKFNGNVPIVTITNDDSIGAEKQIREQGVFFYFVKPFAGEDMVTVIDSAISCRDDSTSQQVE
jgi:DNA-binding NtrC family response regulator